MTNQTHQTTAIYNQPQANENIKISEDELHSLEDQFQILTSLSFPFP